MLSFYFSPMTHDTWIYSVLQIIFSNVSWLFIFSLNEDRRETSTRAWQCLNICQFKIGGERDTWEKKTKCPVTSHEGYEKDEMGGSEKAGRSARCMRELDQSGSGGFQDAEHY